jgi:hypothetical protein
MVAAGSPFGGWRCLNTAWKVTSVQIPYNIPHMGFGPT